MIASLHEMYCVCVWGGGGGGGGCMCVFFPTHIAVGTIQYFVCVCVCLVSRLPFNTDTVNIRSIQAYKFFCFTFICFCKYVNNRGLHGRLALFAQCVFQSLNKDDYYYYYYYSSRNDKLSYLVLFLSMPQSLNLMCSLYVGCQVQSFLSLYMQNGVCHDLHVQVFSVF